MIGLGPTLGQIPWHEKLRRVLAHNRGARLGESTVVSRQVHMSDPRRPEVVTILGGSDAGVIFYGRQLPGEVIHLDVFHQLADVDHRRVAAALRWALAGITPAWEREGGGMLADYFDLMTGCGGGRLTGDLSYGRKESLRAAHRNHVHLAGRLPDTQLHLLLPIVATVEDELRAQSVEIRRLERIQHMRNAGGGSGLDLSHYTDQNDSYLRDQRTPGNAASRPPPAPGGGSSPASVEAGSLRAQRGASSGAGEGYETAPGLSRSQASRAGAASGPGSAASQTGGLPGAGAEGAAGADDGSLSPATPPEDGWNAIEQERRLQSALELSRRLGSPDEVKRVLDQLEAEQGWASLYGSGSSQAPFIIRQLEDEGLVRRDIRGLRLTEAGKALAAYLSSHLRDVKLRFRKLIRRMPASGRRDGKRPGPSTAAPSPDVRYGPIRGAAPVQPGTWLNDLAVTDTLRAALKRTHLERIEQLGQSPPGRTGSGGTTRLRLQRSDVFVNLRSGEQTLNICLLIDASASMAGRRILAAKHLARHLLVSTRDRIAVIAFQERDVRVYVPFTRDWSQVEEGLSRIQPLGLTPLAHGLTQSLDLIRESRVRRPLLLLITDGIPTVPKWTIDPLADALEAARLVGCGRVPFGCIGLQPSKRYLDELVRAANGTLHVVDELNEDALVTIAHEERLKINQKAR